MGRSNNINSGHSRAGEVNEALVENAMNFNAGASQIELKNSQEGEMKTGMSQIEHGNFGDSQEALEEHRSDLLTFLTG
jgi:predicted transcriptional regulator